MEKKTINKIFWIFIVICLVALFFVMNRMIKENNKCISNPFTYGADHLENQIGEKIVPICSCYSINGGSFSFDDQGIYPVNPLTNTKNTGEKFNYSEEFKDIEFDLK